MKHVLGKLRAYKSVVKARKQISYWANQKPCNDDESRMLVVRHDKLVWNLSPETRGACYMKSLIIYLFMLVVY
jgi:hypothetical protein